VETVIDGVFIAGVAQAPRNSAESVASALAATFMIFVDKTYEKDMRGFLVYPDEWDEYYATFRAYDMKIPGGKLTEDHWKIIRFLRESWEKNNTVPNVYETCEATGFQLEELERLFPDGYHRGAVKIAGLKVR